MNVEIIRKRMVTVLRASFHVNEVSVGIVPVTELTRELTKHTVVYAFEFIINNCERYHTFAIEDDSGVLFTRAKEGIRCVLSQLIRKRDFVYKLTGDIHNCNDVIGKFIEGKINLMARNTMESVFNAYSSKASKSYNVCHGFVVSYHHKDSLTFNSAFELLVQATDEPEFKKYNGCFFDGKLDMIVDEKGKICQLSEIFI